MSLRRFSPYVVAVALAVVYLAAAPHTADLAAQTARANLFTRSGFVSYWAGWYSGIPTASYSLVTPPLLGWFGPIWLGALSIVATAAVVVPLLRDTVRPNLGAVGFVISAGLDVVSGRTTFAVGVVLALAALLAVERNRVVVGFALSAVATAASPVAGFLLLVVVAALVVADPPRRRAAVVAGSAVAVALAGLAVLSRGDSGGYEPLTRSSLLMAVGTALVVLIAPVGRRVRTAAVVTVVMLLGVYTVHSPIGANATRLVGLAAAPTVVVSAARARRIVVASAIAVTVLLPLAQVRNDLAASAHHDGSRSFSAPLLAALLAQPAIGDHRVELVDTATHWPSTYLLPRVVLARGWERQTDESRNPMFYGRAPLTPTSYRAFLDRNAVGEVAVAVGAPLDYGATREAALIAAGLPYLHEVWSAKHWRLYAVTDPVPLVSAPARVVGHSDTGLSLVVPSAGTYDVRMRWSPYLVLSGGDVSRAPDGSVRLALSHGGRYRLHAVWRFP